MIFNEMSITFIICNILSVYVVYRFMNQFFEEKHTCKLIEIASYLVYYILLILCYWYVKIPIVMLMFNVISFMLISFNYEASIKDRTLGVVCIYSILFIIEMLIAAITGYIHFPMNSKIEYSSIWGQVANQIVGLTVVNILRPHKNRKRVAIPVIYWFCIIVIPVFSLYFLVMILDIGSLNKINTLLSISFLLVINFSIIYLYDFMVNAMYERTNNLLLEQQNKYYRRQIELMDGMMKSNNSFQHDLNNHLISIESYLNGEEFDNALAYVKKMQKYNNVADDAFSKTGNSVIDSILNLKLQEAAAKGIDIESKICIPKKLDVDSFDLTILLCNVLDNAIEAAEKLEADKKIKILFLYDRRRLILLVENNYCGTIEVRQGQLSTNKSDKYLHGIGLQNIESVVEKYCGTVDITYDENWFKIYIMFYI